MKLSAASQAFVRSFRAAAPYVHTFRGGTFVVAFGGEHIDDGRFNALVHDFNLLAALGVRLVLVHGARPQIEARLAATGHRPQYVRGMRVTDEAALPAVKEAVGRLRVEIEAQLSLGLPNSPMAGADIRVASGNYVTARPVGVVDGVDLQHTGVVRKVDAQALRTRLEQGDLVLLSPLGYSPTGEIFNLTVEEVATEAAVALGADKLIFLMDADGLVDRGGRLVHELSAAEAERYLAPGAQSEDVSLYLPCALRACRAGVARAHLVNARVDGALLLELFTREGVGTMIAQDPLQALRQAGVDDVAGILSLIEPLEADGTLVKRNRERLEMEVERFYVLEHDGTLAGCAALYPFPQAGAAELACLAVHPDWRNGGGGDQLLRHVEAVARRRRIRQLFVLTTRTAHWFLERGFVESQVDALPAEKAALYNWQRRSKVFMKRL